MKLIGNPNGAFTHIKPQCDKYMNEYNIYCNLTYAFTVSSKTNNTSVLFEINSDVSVVVLALFCNILSNPWH